jgi:glyoxylase-like metal-dependent hydrolase (beta-lactamase superfamily II)
MGRIHHLNCGSLYPRFPRMQGIVYCLLVETDDGLALVDSGFGLADYAHPSPLMRAFLWLMGSPRDPQETAIRQVQALGYAPQDVRQIVLTHLHLDHAGGLRDFPWASVHVHRREHHVAMHPRGIVERGYDARHWSHRPRWALHQEADGEWFGFDCIRVRAEPEILLIPLPGHTSGHCGVAIRTAGGWLFHCGDAASPYHRVVDPHQGDDRRHVLGFVPGWLTRRLIGPHVPRLRALVRAQGDVELISGHDVYAFRRHRAVEKGGG